eukprot:6578280-Prymnesium_polylepis.1
MRSPEAFCAACSAAAETVPGVLAPLPGHLRRLARSLFTPHIHTTALAQAIPPAPQSRPPQAGSPHCA